MSLGLRADSEIEEKWKWIGLREKMAASVVELARLGWIEDSLFNE